MCTKHLKVCSFSFDTLMTLHCRLLLHSSGHPRYLQSMVAADDFLLVYGGNTHNDTTKSRGAKCYSSDFLLYDISELLELFYLSCVVKKSFQAVHFFPLPFQLYVDYSVHVTYAVLVLKELFFFLNLQRKA